MAAHAWRAVAGFALLYCGARHLLPAAFAAVAGWGDLAVAAVVPIVLAGPQTRGAYRAFHTFGLADFAAAVGTGLYFTARADHTLFAFPMVLVPWFGVGLSGASRLIALHRLLGRPAVATVPSPARVAGVIIRS